MNKTLLHAGAAYLASVPFAVATLEDLSIFASMSSEDFSREYVSIHALGAAILEYERISMREVQSKVLMVVDDGLSRLKAGFAATGALFADDMVVRAAIRIASESRDYFPERNLDPFRTWAGFVHAQLADAQNQGFIRDGIDLNEVCTLIVAAGIGTKDYIALHDLWGQAEELLEATAAGFVRLVESKSRRLN